MLKVSVVVATYNGEQFIKEQLDSILNQTYPICEVIVKDDGSTDNTVAIVNEYVKKYPIVHLIQNKENMGITKNFLSGFYLAQGDYIAYSDQDDIWMPNKIEKLLSVLGDKNLIYSNSAVCNQDGQYISPLITTDILVSEIISILDLMVWGHQILFRKDVLLEYDFYKFSECVWLDSLLPILAFRGCDNNVIYLDEILVFWRRHFKASSYVSPIQMSKFVKSNSLNKLKGVIVAILSWFNLKKRQNVQKFYSRLKEIPGLQSDTYRVIDLMSSCSLIDVVKAGIICLRNYEKSNSHVSLKMKIRLVLKPFFSIRDQNKGIALDII